MDGVLLRCSDTGGWLWWVDCQGLRAISHTSRPGWAFIFIIEGVLTILIGLAGMFLLASASCEKVYLDTVLFL